MGAHPSTPSFFTNHQPLSSFSTNSTTSSFLRAISPAWPSNANLARYSSTSGSGGGGSAAALGGGGGGGGACDALDVEKLEDMAAGGAAALPGKGFAAGFGRDAAGLSEGPPLRNSLPCVIGRATLALRFAGGFDKLPGGSPEGTWTV